MIEISRTTDWSRLLWNASLIGIVVSKLDVLDGHDFATEFALINDKRLSLANLMHQFFYVPEMALS